MTARWLVLPAVIAACLGATACSQVQAEDAAAAADRFFSAYGSGDGATACAELAPKTRRALESSAGKPCRTAVLEERLHAGDATGSVQVFGTQARVGRGDQTTFLSRFPDGWKVTATECTPRPPKPYECVISGG
jgi:hypothetical protein